MNRKWNKYLIAATAVLLLMAVPLTCRAQYSANVEGTVTDSTGAVVPNASVTLLNAATGVQSKQITNQSGFYRFEAVPPGGYTVVAVETGFKTESIAVTVTADETRGVNVTLVPASSSMNVTVTAVAPDLNPEETRIQTTLPSEEITKLPMVGHDVQQILALTPGVTGFETTSPGQGYGATLFAAGWAPPFQSNGQGTNGNLYLLDDLPVSDDINQGGAIMMPNADMIDQAALQTQTFSVENGTSASLQTSFDTKSGSNDFHGDLDYTYAGANIGAAEGVYNTISTDPVTGVPFGAPFDEKVGDFHQNNLLGSVGGPIFKGKTFFFASLQKLNSGAGGTAATGQDDWDPAFIAWGLQNFPNSGTAKGMTLAPNSADVPGPSYSVKTVADVLGSTACPTTNSTYSGVIPISTDAAISGPNAGATLGGEAYTIPCSMNMYDHGQIFNQAQPFDGLQFSGRIDQVFRNGDRVYALYERIHQTLGDLSDRPALDSATPSTNKMGTINWVHVFSPRLLNEIHGGNIRTTSGQILTDPAVGDSIPYEMLGLDSTDGYQFFFLYGANQPFAPDSNLEHTYNLRDTVSYTLHNHTIRGGYQYTREDYLVNETLYARGGFGFNISDAFSMISNEANYAYDLWSISGINGEYQAQYYGATSNFNGLWFDDTWKVRPNLTITAGIRYDDFGNPAPYSNSGDFSPLFPGSGSTFQQQTWNTTVKISTHAFLGPQNENWQPRIGFAYTPFKNQDLTVHGGFGLYENALTPSQIANNLPTQPPVRISLALNSRVPYGDFQTTTGSFGETYDGQLPFPVYGDDPSGNVYSNAAHTSIYSVNLNGFDPNVKPEKFLNYSLGVEKQLPAHIVAGIAYSGSHGYDLVMGAQGQGPNGASNSDWNLAPGSVKARPSAEWGQLLYAVNAAGVDSNFNALLLTLKQHYKGLSYQANYNWERSLQWAPTYADSAAGKTIAVWPGIYQAKTYYGPTSIDVADSFSFGGSYVVPKISTNNHLLDEAASGWGISTITVAQTGTPFTVGNTSGPSYADDNSWGFDSNSGGTPAFPTPPAGLARKGFSRHAVSTTGVFTGKTFTDPAGAGSGYVLSQQGANTFRNPGYFNVNSSLSKSFAVPFIGSEAANLTLRGDFINLLNRTNWGPITNDVASGINFGFSAAAYNKRFLQLGARFEF